MLTSYSTSPSFPSSVCPMALWSRPMRRVRWSSCRTCWRSRTTSWPRWRSACPPSPPGFPRWSRSSRPPARTSSSQRRWTTSTRGTSKRSQHRNWAQGEAYTHTHTYSHGDNSCKRNIKDSEQWSKNSFYLHMLSHSPQLFITPSFSHIKTCTLTCEHIRSFIMPSSGEVS